MRVAELRRRRGWTQEGLGEKAGMHPTYIGGIERGERNLSLVNLEKIAKAFDMPLGAFLSGEPEGIVAARVEPPPPAQPADFDLLFLSYLQFFRTHCLNCDALATFRAKSRVLTTPSPSKHPSV
ncbi:MAG: helix-turn-helix transcriptional regulator [Nitrospirota bacterium]